MGLLSLLDYECEFVRFVCLSVVLIVNHYKMGLLSQLDYMTEFVHLYVCLVKYLSGVDIVNHCEMVCLVSWIMSVSLFVLSVMLLLSWDFSAS